MSGRGAFLRGLKGVPAGLVGMIGLLLAVEGFVAGRADGLATYSALGARFAGRAAAREAVPARVLAVGDSVLKFGFDPAAFESGLGRPATAYNLAVPGTPTLLGEALLRRALAAGARPEAVLVGYMTLSGDPLVHLNDFAEVFGPADALRLARDARDPALFLGVMAPRLLPTLRYRNALRAGPLAALGRGPGGAAGSGVAGPTAAAESLRSWAKNRGAGLHEPDGRFDGRMEPELEKRLYSSPWLVHPVLARSFRRICDLAAGSGASVYVVVTPIAPEAQARRDALGLDAPHTRNLRALVSRTPGLTVLDARRSGLPAGAFFDSCHLNADGAARLSASIGAAVGRPPGPPPGGPISWLPLAVPSGDPPPRLATDSTGREPAR